MSAIKRVTITSSSPLEDVGILLHVLSILGPEHHLFISAVSKPWAESYERVDSVQMLGLAYYYSIDAPLLTVKSQTTLASAAFESASRVRLAYQSGLRSEGQNGHLQRITGRAADVATLQVAHGLGLDLGGVAEATLGAAEAASVPKLQFLHTELGCPLHEDITYYAAQCGSEGVLRWLKEHGVTFTAITCRGAAAGAHLHVLQILRDEGCEWDATTCTAAAKRGHLAVLQWLHEQGCPWHAATICGDAAESGSIEMLRYLREQGCEYNEDTTTAAALKGQLAVCQYLMAEQCPVDEFACDNAAGDGFPDIVRFLHESGCPWDAGTSCTRAAGSGNIDILQYLKQQGATFDAGSMSAAAQRGHTHVCQYLRAEQCAWDTTACDNAAGGGHVDTLRWLHEQGCPWNIHSARFLAAR
jgi:hypothetical protein